MQPRQRRLPAAGLAHQAQGLAPPDVEADAVHGVHDGSRLRRRRLPDLTGKCLVTPRRLSRRPPPTGRSLAASFAAHVGSLIRRARRLQSSDRPRRAARRHRPRRRCALPAGLGHFRPGPSARAAASRPSGGPRRRARGAAAGSPVLQRGHGERAAGLERAAPAAADQARRLAGDRAPAARPRARSGAAS